VARKIDDTTEFLLKDIQKEEDVVEISNYLEEAEYKLEDLEEILVRILVKYADKKSGKDNIYNNKEYLN
jgi:hypothetical protein